MKKILILLIALSLPITLSAQSTITVDLSWTASTSPAATGYNVWRVSISPTAATCPAFIESGTGAWTLLNTTQITTTTYVDNSAPVNTGLCYGVVTAATAGGNTGYSAPATVLLPASSQNVTASAT